MTKFHSSFLKYRHFWRCTVVNTSNYSLTFIFLILDSKVCRALSQSASVALWRPSSKNVLYQLRLTLSPVKICSVFSVPLMLVLLIFWGIMNRRSRKGGKPRAACLLLKHQTMSPPLALQEFHLLFEIILLFPVDVWLNLLLYLLVN